MPRQLTGVLVAAALLFLSAPAASAATFEAPFDDAEYFAFMDAMQARMDPLWSDKAGFYASGGLGTGPMTNGAMLHAHAIAALRGHTGLSRNDARARRLAERLTRRLPFVDELRDTPPNSPQRHVPGWLNSMRRVRGSGQHLVYDSGVIDALAAAWRAREQLALAPETVAAIEDRIGRTARGRFYRYPAIRLNQINWYALVYAATATVNGDTSMLRSDLTRQLRRFVAGMRDRGEVAGNFGPGLRFHYLPHKPITWAMNLDSAEYANIVLGVTRFFDAGVAAGMRMPAGTRGLFRRWALRALTGYWTHAGYLNWDTGLGFERWHQTKKIGLAQEGLLGLAASESLKLDGRLRAWAKQLLDRGFVFYERQAERAGGLPGGLFYGVNVVPQGQPNGNLAAARMIANAARAIDAGLGSRPATELPAVYSYDPDIGRLAITTPTYNTAIVPVNQNAFPYGGIELARLFDADQDVIANIGGHGLAGFGLEVRDAHGRRELVTQEPREDIDRTRSPLRLTLAPAGVDASPARTRAGRVYAGSFDDLRATGTVETARLFARAEHRFTPTFIETRWTARRKAAARAYTADVRLPTPRGARLTAVLRDGTRMPLRAAAQPVAPMAAIEVATADGAYVAEPRLLPAGATVRTVAVRRQASAPRPGRAIVIRIARGSSWASSALELRLTVVPSPGAP